MLNGNTRGVETELPLKDHGQRLPARKSNPKVLQHKLRMHRLVLTMRFRDGLKLKEIAQRLNISRPMASYWSTGTGIPKHLRLNKTLREHYAKADCPINQRREQRLARAEEYQKELDQRLAAVAALEEQHGVATPQPKRSPTRPSTPSPAPQPPRKGLRARVGDWLQHVGKSIASEKE